MHDSVYEISGICRAKILKSLPGLTLITVGKPYFLVKEGTLSEEAIRTMGPDVRVYTPGHPPEDYRAMIRKGVDQAVNAVSGAYDVVILDEYNMAAWYELASEEDTERILKARNPGTELIFTGRNAPELLLQKADLITEMKKIRHYYDKGVMARKGIED